MYRRLLSGSKIVGSLLALLLAFLMASRAPGEPEPLEHPVHLELRYGSVEELCRALSTEQVRLVPGSREIGDYKVHALLREVRLREVMDGVTRLFTLPDTEAGLIWQRQAGAEGVTYRLTARPDFARRLTEVQRKPWDQLRQRLELLRDWPAMRPERRAEVARQHPVVARQAGLAWDADLVQLFWSHPGAPGLLNTALDTSASRHRITLRYGEANPEQQRLIAGLRESLLANQSGGTGKPVGSLEEASLEFLIVPNTPVLYWRMPVGKGQVFLGELASPSMRLPSGLLLDHPDASPTLRGGWAGNGTPEGAPGSEKEEGAGQEGAKISYLFEALRALHQPRRTNFLTHARTVPPSPYRLPGGGTLEARLDGVGKQYSYRFYRAGALVLGEDTGWILDHEEEVPVRLLQRWAQRKQAQGRIGLDELAEMAQLSREQGKRLRITFPEVAGGSPLLRVWAQLTPAQRRAARSPQGVALRADPELGVRPGAILRVDAPSPNTPLGDLRSDPAGGSSLVRFTVQEVGGRYADSSPLPPPDPQFRVEDIRR